MRVSDFTSMHNGVNRGFNLPKTYAPPQAYLPSGRTRMDSIARSGHIALLAPVAVPNPGTLFIGSTENVLQRPIIITVNQRISLHHQGISPCVSMFDEAQALTTRYSTARYVHTLQIRYHR